MWITPKTDWSGGYDESGVYVGDYFNVVDYNRIIGNLNHLANLQAEICPPKVSIDLGDEKICTTTRIDNIYADEINKIEDMLDQIAKTVGVDAGDKQTFYDNGKFIGYAELNRIESFTLSIYNRLVDIRRNARRTVFRASGLKAYNI